MNHVFLLESKNRMPTIKIADKITIGHSEVSRRWTKLKPLGSMMIVDGELSAGSQLSFPIHSAVIVQGPSEVG
jgi:hypothetical protein